LSLASSTLPGSQGLVVLLPLWPALFACAAAAGLGLRLGALDGAPLSPREAAWALEGLAIWRGGAGEYAAGPILSNVLAVWFALFTAADGQARAPSALVGWAVTLTPLLFRSRLGWPATVGACVLLAVSPLEVLPSRSAQPAVFVTLAAAVTVGCLFKALEQADPPRAGWLIGSGIAIGLGLGSDPAFVGQLLAIAVALAACPPTDMAPTPTPPPSLGEGRGVGAVPRAIGVGLAAALLADTLLLTRPGGMQAGLVDPLPAWLASLGLSESTLLAGGLLAAHEMPLLALALYGLLRFWRDSPARFLALWALAGLMLAALTRTPDLGALAAPTVPLALLGGLGLTRLDWLLRHQPASSGAIWVAAASMLAPVVFVGLRLNSGFDQGATPLSALIIGAAGFVAVLLLANTWLRLSELGISLALLASVGLLALQVAFLTRLNYAGFERAGPSLVSESSRPEIRLVEARVRDWRRQEPDQPIRVDASLRPILAWSMRDGPPVEWVSTAPSTPERAILGVRTAASRPSADWQRLVVAERYEPPPGLPSPGAIWRWLVQRQPLVHTEPHAVFIAR
jgi:hypothetical protein